MLELEANWSDWLFVLIRLLPCLCALAFSYLIQLIGRLNSSQENCILSYNKLLFVNAFYF